MSKFKHLSSDYRIQTCKSTEGEYHYLQTKHHILTDRWYDVASYSPYHGNFNLHFVNRPIPKNIMITFKLFALREKIKV